MLRSSQRQGTRVQLLAGAIFNRQARDTGIHGEQHVGTHVLRLIRKAGLKVRVHWQVGRATQRPQMSQYLVAGELPVVPAHRPSVSGTR